MKYIEKYSSGLNRIYKEYKNCKEKPVIETTLNMFKITLPNVNYLCDAQNLVESKNDAQNDAQNISIENILIDLIINNPTITRKEMAVTIDKSKPTIERIIKKVEKNQICRFI